jgi:hypothetical protein
MFVKLKEYILNDELKYNGFTKLPKYIADKNIAIIECDSKQINYEENGWTKILDYVHFTDNGSKMLWTIPEFTELILECTRLFDNGFCPDKTSELLLNTIMPKAENIGLIVQTNKSSVESAGLISETNNIYDIYFAVNHVNQLNLSKKRNNSIRVCRGGSYDFVLPDIASELYYATVIDNEIVSISGSTHTSPFKSEVVDISADTLEEHRGKGYAVSNVISLAEYLLSGAEDVKQVKEVIYPPVNINKNSIKVAKSAGFIEAAYRYSICCKRIV